MINFLDGNEAIARAAVYAGCSFFAGYPITPATTILHHMLQLLPHAGGICMQGEDEISSIGLCLGASMGGAKVMTATSGPGISLMSEHISFAVGSEIPVVIVDVQRLGPSTGSATKGADGDIQFLRWGNSGGVSGIVLAPVNVHDCFTLTVEAFNLAETYRCPVFIASNKEIGMTRESMVANQLNLPKPVMRSSPPSGHSGLPFEPVAETLVPPFKVMAPGRDLSRITSSTHGPNGYITTDPSCISTTIKRLQDKLNSAIQHFTYYDLYETAESKTLIITYGVTSRAAKDALNIILNANQKASLLILKTLYPVLEQVIQAAVADKKKVLVVEMNNGQYINEIERIVKMQKILFLGRMNGELITPSEIAEEVLS